MSDNNAIIYYSAESEPERLTATTVHDAVVDAVDQWAEPPGPDDEIEVTSYKRMELPPRETIAGWAIDHVTEELDEEFGDPDGFSTTLNPDDVRDAALAFADAVREKYESWACEPVTRFKEKVRDHVPEDWIRVGEA